MATFAPVSTSRNAVVRPITPAIAQKLPGLDAGTRILGFNYDTGERYLSVPDFLPEE